MRTTMLIVEILVGGVLISLALGAFLASFFYDIDTIYGHIETIFNTGGIDQSQSFFAGALLLLSTVFIAIAYTVGVFSEPIAREIFERRLLNKVQEGYVGEYLDMLEKKYAIKDPKDPISRRLKENYDSSKKNGKNQVRFPTGDMRFYVSMKSPELYQNIVLQLHRFRLMRMLFVAEFIFIVAIIMQLYREVSSFWMLILVILIIIAFISFIVICGRMQLSTRLTGLKLRQNIASKLKKSWLIVSFFVELILIAVIIWFYREVSPPLVRVLTILIIVAFINIIVIRDRFKRYCRDIGRSYVALIIDDVNLGENINLTRLYELAEADRRD